jgi:hypothetical protein
VDVEDENGEELGRELDIAYSRSWLSPIQLLEPFTVTYTVSTPWTHPPSTSLTRQVIVLDFDECLAARNNSVAVGCHQMAACVNLPGSFTCKCPAGTSGDGFVPTQFTLYKPTGYEGGTGCRDHCPPEISLHGGIKKFHACACDGLNCERTNTEKSKQARQAKYMGELIDHVKSADTRELCADTSR